MAEEDGSKKDGFDPDKLLAGGATWGGKEKRDQVRIVPAVEELVEPSELKPEAISPEGEAKTNGESSVAAAAPLTSEVETGEPTFRWRRPGETRVAENGNEERRGGVLKRGGSGSSFVMEPEPEKAAKVKRKLFTRQERLKVEKPKGSKDEVVAVDNRVVRGRAAKLSRLKSPTHRHHMAVISGAGGTGKTTTALMLGWLLAEARETGVVVLEAMPAGGALARRMGVDMEMSSADVFRVADHVQTLSDLQAVTQRFAKLEVVGTGSKPRLSDLLDPSEHERVLETLLHYYSIVVSDTETGLLSPRTTATLEWADQIVFCITTDEGAAQQAAATLNWLLYQGGEAADLARRTVVVAHEVRPGTLENFGMAKEQLASACRAVLVVPFDAQFARGGALDFTSIADVTYDAYLDLAVELAHEFGVISR